MGVVADAIAALKEVMRMQGDLDRLSRNVDTLSHLVTDLDRRVIRIETMVEIASRRGGSPAKLPKS
jgi:t-SNARE complex subunit (syntaxin)